MIEAVVFDIGGVLAHDIWENLLPRIATIERLDKEQTKKVGALLWEAFAYRPETAINSWRDLEIQYWRLFVKSLWDKSIKKEKAKEKIEKFIKLTDKFVNYVDAKMIDILGGLQSNGIKLAICSNNNEFWYRYQMDKLKLHRYFSPSKVILSCKVGVSKSSPRFEMFHAVVDSLQLTPNKCLFVDDRADNVNRAKECGMQGVLFSKVHKEIAKINKNCKVAKDVEELKCFLKGEGLLSDSEG
jgi:HAD superfamily hydrolase (TIGR01509 family)